MATLRLARRPIAATAALRVVLILAAACRPSDTGRSAERKTAPPPPIVLISIDTLRSDHLPAYGYRGVETPNIDRLRRDSILYSAVFSQVPLTLPSHATILTGLLPEEHGVRDNLGYRLDAARHPTLPARLKATGYATGAAVSAAVLARSTGLSASFDFYDDAVAPATDSEALGRAQRAGSATLDAAMRWLPGVADRPFFLFVHLYEPHAPYEPPPPFRERYSGNPYDGEIAAADAVVGTLLDSLRERAIYDRAVVLLLSDHGEGLGDHGEEEHGILLYREALAVPLLLKLPRSDRAGEVVSQPAGLIDVAPTLAALAGASPLPNASGENLLALPRDRGIVSETFYPRIHLGWSALRSLFDGSHHLIDAPRPELFAIGSDPGERRDLFAAEPAIARSMKRELDRRPSAFEAPAVAGNEQARRLASLGYLSASGEAGPGPLPNPADHIGDVARIRAAFRLAAAGERDRAVAAFRSLLAGNPRLFDVQYRLAETLRDLRHGREAEEEFGKAIAISPSLAGPGALEIARLAAARGDWEKAASHARLALESSPAAAHEMLARAALGRGDAKVALSEASLARQDPTDPSAARRAAVVAAGAELALGHVPEALAILSSENAKPPSPGSGPLPRDFEFFRGDALARAGRTAEAEASFRREIAGYPDNVDAYSRLAVLLAVDHRRAADVYSVLEAMARANPGPEPALLAARTLESIGDAPGAARWRRRAADRAPLTGARGR